MYYTEYGVAARTHYKSCKAMFEQCFCSKAFLKGDTEDILFRIYYLCGHIVECTAVYLIYKHYQWERNDDRPTWKGEEEHIYCSYNKRFTEESHMDFYPLKIQNGQVCSSRRKTKDKQYIIFCSASEGEKEENYYDVQHHNFQKYVKGLIRKMSFKEVPYLNDSIDSKYDRAINLLDNWNTDLRYYYKGRSCHYIKDENKLSDASAVDVESIKQLIEVCGKIVALIPSGNTL